MAVVGQKDQYGSMKYGFINNKGEQAIPFMFSKEPSYFSYGFAKVKPKDIGEFEYAFINKKGEIAFTQTTSDKRKYGNFEFNDFQNYGITTTVGNAYVMDTLFRIRPKADFFAAYGITGIPHFKSAYYEAGNGKIKMGKAPFSVVGETNPKIYFSTTTSPADHIGFINLGTNTVVLPAFSRLGYFDPVSRLAYAEVDNRVQKGGHKVTEITKGYINEHGEWVILQKKGSKW
jgi:hypothetical protein